MSDNAAGDKRSSADTDGTSRKKMKKEDKHNPYLAHMYDNGDEDYNGEAPAHSPFAGMKRRATSAKQAAKAEDLDTNPFTGRAHSQKYFQILQGRRDLPVHKQRCASFLLPTFSSMR